MDWTSIIGSIIFALMAAIGLPLALRKRKKGGPQSIQDLFNHLRGMGIKVFLMERDVEEEKVGVNRGFSQRSEGVIRIEGRNVDFINVVSAASQHGVNYFVDFLVKTPGMPDKRHRKRTRLVRKKSSGVRGRIADIEWKGDDYLSRELNVDYSL